MDEEVKVEGQEEVKETSGSEQKEEKMYSQAELDEIIKKRVGRLQADQDKKVKEAVEEQLKIEKMNDEEKRNHEIEKITKENEELKAQQLRYSLEKEATTILSSNGIDVTEDTLNLVVGPDSETTQSNINQLKSIIDSALKKAEKERNTGSTPRSYGTDGNQLNAFQERMAKYRK